MSDTVVMKADANITVLIGPGIVSSGTIHSTSVRIDGDVIARSTGISMSATDVGVSTGVGNHSITTGVEGSVVGGSTGVNFSGSGNTLVNFGEIAGLTAGGVQAFSNGGDYFQNFGILTGVISSFSSDPVIVENSGTIFGGEAAIKVQRLDP